MFSKLILALTLLSTYSLAYAEDGHQEALDRCISAWGKSPFKKGSPADKTIDSSVKVFGIGKNREADNEATKKPVLVLVRPSVNVLGKSTIRLMNPNGWYCFKSNVTVLGKINIEAHCDAHIASAQDGAEVLAADETNKGVAVLGALRITRLGCK